MLQYNGITVQRCSVTVQCYSVKVLQCSVVVLQCYSITVQCCSVIVPCCSATVFQCSVTVLQYTVQCYSVTVYSGVLQCCFTFHPTTASKLNFSNVAKFDDHLSLKGRQMQPHVRCTPFSALNTHINSAFCVHLRDYDKALTFELSFPLRLYSKWLPHCRNLNPHGALEEFKQQKTEVGCKN